MNHSKFSLFALVFWICIACKQDAGFDELDLLHVKMTERLAALEDQLDPAINIYANEKRSDYFLKKHHETKGLEQVKNLGLHAQELLYAGHTENALTLLDSVKSLLVQASDSDVEFQAALERVQGIGWLRLGEQRNCILNHNHQSCIIPIEGRAIHQDREGSERAIEQFKFLLDQEPNNYTLIWLLNLAYMTLGEYPDQVPEEFLIPPSVFEEQRLIPKFPEIAGKLGLDQTGLSGGSIVEDFNNDGWFDIAASSWGIQDQVRVYLQDGAGRFIERTQDLGLMGITGGLNMVQADYNNDGFMDIFILRGAWMELDGRHPNSLLMNIKGERFMDVTESAGLLSFHPTQTASWGDFNNDGHIDLFVGNESTPGCSNACELFQNNGDGTFTEVAEYYDLDVRGYIKGVIWADYNQDGFIDLFLSNLDGPNLLFANQGPDEQGHWRFNEVGDSAGIQNPMNSFPCWFFDYDQDGWEDLFVSGYKADAGEFAKELLGLPTQCELPRLYHNNRDGTFTEVSQKQNVDKVLYTMGSNFGDLNNDNFPDMYIGTGDPDFRAVIPNRMFFNLQGSGFSEVTYQGGFGHIQKGHGVSFADLDRDGDQDIFTVIGGALQGDVYQNALFENPATDNSWISVKLQGVKSNRAAIGSRLILTLDSGLTYYRTINSGGSFGCNPMEQHFGIPEGQAVTELNVFWAGSQTVQSYSSLTANNRYVITEGNDAYTQEALTRLVWKPVQETHHRHNH